MGPTALLSTLLIASVIGSGGLMADGKGKASTGSSKGGSSSSSSSKSAHVPQISSKGSNKSSINDSPKSKAGMNSTAAAVAPLDDSKAALQSVEVDMIKGLEKEGLQADLKKNRVWFQNYLADDVTGAKPDGSFEDKTRMMARSLDPANVVESKTYDELNVRPYGDDVIVATGKLSVKGKNGNATYDTQRTFIHVWVNRLGQWQQVAVQESPVAAGGTANQSITPTAGPESGPEAAAPSPSAAKATLTASNPTSP